VQAGQTLMALVVAVVDRIAPRSAQPCVASSAEPFAGMILVQSPLRGAVRDSQHRKLVYDPCQRTTELFKGGIRCHTVSSPRSACC
jgi:hypothetical protein